MAHAAPGLNRGTDKGRQMETASSNITHAKVANYLTDSRERFERFLAVVVDLARSVSYHPTTRGMVYLIYTRADKQNGEIFKDVWKIVEKADAAAIPYHQLYFIRDIIGVTIVVVYPSDIDVVRKIIDERIHAHHFVSVYDTAPCDDHASFYGETKRHKGYYAHHYTLEVGKELGKPDLLFTRCELQIKTVLHDAWGAKTHDLTYKRAGALDERMNKQAEVLGDVLAGIDQQSELLRHLIQGRWVLEEHKSNTAKEALLQKTLMYDDELKQSKYLEIRDRIKNSGTILK
jgi:ppGpp synthetase/RelA/SpoT-type nucleotidyltranferase